MVPSHCSVLATLLPTGVMSRHGTTAHRDELLPVGPPFPPSGVVGVRPRPAVTTELAVLVAPSREQGLRVSQTARGPRPRQRHTATDRSTATDDVLDHPTRTSRLARLA